MYASYAYNSKSDSETCHVEPAVRQLIKQEESIGQQGHSRSYLSRSARQGSVYGKKSNKNQASSSSSSSESSEQYSKSSRGQQKKSPKSPKVHQQIRMLESKNKICFSEKKVEACPYGYQPKGGKTISVQFSCYKKNSSVANEIKQQLKSRFVDLSQSQYRSYAERQTLDVHEKPNQCVRSY